MLSIGIISLLIAVPLFSYRITPILFNRITCVTLIYSSLLAYNSLYIESLVSGIGIYSGLFQVTPIITSIESFILFIGALAIISWPSLSSDMNSVEYTNNINNSNNNNKASVSLKDNNTKGPVMSEYSLIVLFTTIGGSLLISSSDIISIYLSIELQSFAVYILATLYRNSESSTSAGLKYFLLGGLSSALILLGSAIIYSYTGITQFESIYSLVSVEDINFYFNNIIIDSFTGSYHGKIFMSLPKSAWENTSLIFGLILIGVGFLFKVSAAPFHNWAPDVYNGVPTIVTSWLTTIPKISIFVFFLELQTGFGFIDYCVTFTDFTNNIKEGVFNYSSAENFMNISEDGQDQTFIRGAFWKNLLVITSLISLIIGTIVGLSQYKIKRLLAYSTISHVGFLLLALSINTQESIEAFIFYIIQYSITNINIFIIILAFAYMLQKSINYGMFGAAGCSASQIKNNYINTGAAASAAVEKNVDVVPNNINKYMPFFFAPLVDQKNSAPQVSTNNIKNNYRLFNTINKDTDIIFINEIKGQFYSNPLLSLSISLSLFSIAGIPPLIGFFAKQIVLYSSIHAGYYFISVVAIVVSVISASYYLKIIKVICFDSTTVNNIDNNKYINRLSNCTNVHSMIIATITIAITLFVLEPSILLNSCHLLALSLFYY